ncbi:bifunctional 2-C-methyl-D-erythritol 4-phosphate cytidylyltransferase/2-C-methyl-D-erythritol 2,4-cyclodiphosphate synthase [Kordiimonas pumila]|uniref:Bifunctional enzyme IspD/IspF n=1 Tax=Kordiimonas pumila TaxID=2161677 RepID=A0ABV7D2C2_9PROT|nr:bifunctional 2-C-methyl-D-erythritol 4-phosphate cytidylyltransferase/2-C-methyl-D-erythritol 2,4-cyclodiphosphate synthase [Kordiimonas pumila]
MPDKKQKSQTLFSHEKRTNMAYIIVAAGKGQRAGTVVPKQYCLIAGKMLLTHTVKALRQANPDALFVVVINEDDHDLATKALAGAKNIITVTGGATRQESVYAGLTALKAEAPEFVFVHDAARPFVSSVLIVNIESDLQKGADAVIPALAITDTLKRATNGMITDTIDRAGLYAVQTPQAFNYSKLLSAHETAPHNDFTDDAAVFEYAGGTIHICAGDEGNFKVTHPADFAKAEAQMMLACSDIRVGHGFDVHAFETGDHVTLCGVDVPFTKKLKGHSDADVGLHALTDAILSAIAAGDIGTHFPPSDEKWRGVESHVFLAHAAQLVAKKQGIVSHITVLLICEQPKIGPHVQAMRQAIAGILSISIDRVSVQATTTEKLGFTGRKEGIAAEATATIRLPFGVPYE